VDEKTAAEIHDLVYAVAKEQGLDSKKFFQAIYLAFLGDRQGPRWAGSWPAWRGTL